MAKAGALEKWSDFAKAALTLLDVAGVVPGAGVVVKGWGIGTALAKPLQKGPSLDTTVKKGRRQLKRKLETAREKAGDEAEAVETQVLSLIPRTDREELLSAAFRGESEFRAQLDGFDALLRDFGGPGRHYAEVLLGGLWGLVCEYARSPEVLGQVTQAGLNNLDNLAREVADLRSTMAQQIAAAVQQELARRPKQIVEGRRPLQVSGFVDRPEFGRLRGVLDASDAVCLLSGISGVGKSQLATAYAEECINDHWQFVGWITATSRSEIIAQMAEIAWSHDLTDDADAGKAAARLVAWLTGSGPGPRLLVFDDVRAVDDLRAGDDAAGSLIPSGPGMRVLITTTRELNLSGEHVTVEEFTSDQAVEYLSRVSGDPDRDGAGKVAEALGYLPLALTQAAANIDLHGYRYSEYLETLYRQRLDVSLKRPDGEPYPRLVGVALCLAFQAALDKIYADAPDAALSAHQSLDVVSLLAESGVLRGWLYRISDSTVTNRKAVGLLLKTGVLAQSADHTVVSLHQLQSRVWRETLDTVQQETAVAATARVLSQVTIPQDADWETTTRPTAQELASQLIALWEQSQTRSQPSARQAQEEKPRPFAHALFSRMVAFMKHGSSGSQPADRNADLFFAVTSHPEVLAASINAVRWCIEAGLPGLGVDLAPYTSLCEQILGPHHPDTLNSRNNLANAYRDAGNLDQAIPLHEQNLTDTERILGPHHPDTLTSRGNLALAYRDAGNLEQAIPLHEQNLTDTERILGPTHPQTLASRGNLAAAYRDAGDLDRAIALFEQNLTEAERILGPRHPDTLISRNNLAYAYQDAGNLDRAIALFEQNLTDRERILGPRHPDTLISRNNLALAYQEAGNLDQAIALFQQNLTDQEQILGPHHPDTLISRNNLATAYKDAGNLDQAITLYKQNLTDRERILGPRHPDTLISRGNLAAAYKDAGDLDRAIALFEQNLTDRERILGPRHPDTLTSRNNLAYAYQDAGKLDQAIALHEQNLTDQEQVLGPRHPDTLISRGNLATAYQDAGNLDQAIALYEQNLTDQEQVLGPRHRDTLASRNNLALAYQAAGNLDQAITLFEQNLTDTEQVLGPRHRDTLASRNNLALAYHAAGKLDQAIALYEQALSGVMEVLGDQHPTTLGIRRNLKQAYRERDETT